MPEFTPEQAEELSQAEGQGQHASWRRLRVFQQMGLAEALGLSFPEWVKKYIGSYAHISIDERRGAVAELAAEGLPNTHIAGVLGVDETTIRRDRSAFAELASDSEIESVTRHSANAEAEKVLAQVQPFAGLQEEDHSLLEEFHRAHVRVSHVVSDLLQFDLGRVVWLCDPTDLKAIEAGIDLMRTYEREMQRARGEG